MIPLAVERVETRCASRVAFGLFSRGFDDSGIRLFRRYETSKRYAKILSSTAHVNISFELVDSDSDSKNPNQIN